MGGGTSSSNKESKIEVELLGNSGRIKLFRPISYEWLMDQRARLRELHLDLGDGNTAIVYPGFFPIVITDIKDPQKIRPL